MMKLLFTLALFFSLTGCKIPTVLWKTENRVVKSPQIVGIVDSVEYLDFCCNFMNHADTTTLAIIMYAKGCSCGVLSCASNCVGVTDNNDTIRVLSLCENKSFNLGQIVTVIPNNFEISGDLNNIHITQQWESYGDNRVGLSYLTSRRFNTIWGKLKVQEKRMKR